MSLPSSQSSSSTTIFQPTNEKPSKRLTRSRFSDFPPEGDPAHAVSSQKESISRDANAHMFLPHHAQVQSQQAYPPTSYFHVPSGPLYANAPESDSFLAGGTSISSQAYAVTPSPPTILHRVSGWDAVASSPVAPGEHGPFGAPSGGSHFYAPNYYSNSTVSLPLPSPLTSIFPGFSNASTVNTSEPSSDTLYDPAVLPTSTASYALHPPVSTVPNTPNAPMAFTLAPPFLPPTPLPLENAFAIPSATTAPMTSLDLRTFSISHPPLPNTTSMPIFSDAFSASSSPFLSKETFSLSPVAPTPFLQSSIPTTTLPLNLISPPPRSFATEERIHTGEGNASYSVLTVAHNHHNTAMPMDTFQPMMYSLPVDSEGVLTSFPPPPLPSPALLEASLKQPEEKEAVASDKNLLFSPYGAVSSSSPPQPSLEGDGSTSLSNVASPLLPAGTATDSRGLCEYPPLEYFQTISPMVGDIKFAVMPPFYHLEPKLLHYSLPKDPFCVYQLTNLDLSPTEKLLPLISLEEEVFQHLQLPLPDPNDTNVSSTYLKNVKEKDDTANVTLIDIDKSSNDTKNANTTPLSPSPPPPFDETDSTILTSLIPDILASTPSASVLFSEPLPTVGNLPSKGTSKKTPEMLTTPTASITSGKNIDRQKTPVTQETLPQFAHLKSKDALNASTPFKHPTKPQVYAKKVFQLLPHPTLWSHQYFPVGMNDEKELLKEATTLPLSAILLRYLGVAKSKEFYGLFKKDKAIEIAPENKEILLSDSSKFDGLYTFQRTFMTPIHEAKVVKDMFLLDLPNETSETASIQQLTGFLSPLFSKNKIFTKSEGNVCPPIALTHRTSLMDTHEDFSQKKEEDEENPKKHTYK